MIQIERDVEPEALAALRVERLAAARAAAREGRRIEFEDYALVKAELAAMQRNKCCYCEKREEQAKYRDVEHYRPKSEYWWLAWTWENLLFSCIDCNREHKRDQFPLSDGDRALVPEEAVPGTERPMVLDPTDRSTHPMAHIRFHRARVQRQERWLPEGVTARGWRTIEVCGLARPGLLDLYKEHVDHVVRPKVAQFHHVLDLQGNQDAAPLYRAWQTLLRGVLGLDRPFRALAHDAIEILVDRALRERRGLILEYPSPSRTDRDPPGR